MASTKFAYLKSQKGEAPFYVHLTLDEKEQSLRVYYHWSFWKKEEVDLTVFQTWMDHFKNVEPLLTKRKKKNTLVVKRNSVKVRGRCIILSQMFKDIIGFTEKNTEHELPAKIECYANAENRMIEVELQIPYKPLGDLPHELRKLPIFTKQPDFESVRTRLTFFNMNYIKNTSKPIESVVENTTREVDDMKLDPQFCQENQHPYGETLKTSEKEKEKIDTTESKPEEKNVGTEKVGQDIV